MRFCLHLVALSFRPLYNAGVKRLMVKAINWGVNHFTGWLTGIFVASLITELANHIGEPTLIEVYVTSQQFLGIASLIIDIQWWIVFAYSAIVFCVRLWRRGFRIHF